MIGKKKEKIGLSDATGSDPQNCRIRSDQARKKKLSLIQSDPILLDPIGSGKQKKSPGSDPIRRHRIRSDPAQFFSSLIRSDPAASDPI